MQAAEQSGAFVFASDSAPAEEEEDFKEAEETPVEQKTEVDNKVDST